MKNENLIDENFINEEIPRDTLTVDNEMNNFMTTEEGEKIKADIQLLKDMGYDIKMINKVYILLKPESIERAIDFMTEINGIYQHNYFESYNQDKYKDLCFICKKPKQFHLDYIPETLLSQNNIIFEIENNVDSFKKDNDKENLNYFNNDCDICYEEVPESEKKSNTLPCGHLCCTHCWIDYFKTAITEAKVENIKCVDYSCKEIISEDFILKYIKDDKALVDKYKKFKLRAEIMNDKNKKQCPHPDCESYLEKSDNSKYVKCKNNHEYCFECLKPPHGKISCEDNVDKQFLKWKKHKRIKKCPKCGIYIEKNEGCNHMTCKSCRYEWCWLCEGQYNYCHFSTGKCKGHQYTRANNLRQANICCFTVVSLFPCFYTKIIGVFPIEWLIFRYLAILGLWIFGFFFFAGFSMFNYTEKHIEELGCSLIIYYISGFLIALCLLVCFQILFACLVTPFVLIALVYPNFLDIILVFLNIGN